MCCFVDNTFFLLSECIGDPETGGKKGRVWLPSLRFCRDSRHVLEKKKSFIVKNGSKVIMGKRMWLSGSFGVDEYLRITKNSMETK